MSPQRSTLGRERLAAFDALFHGLLTSIVSQPKEINPTQMSQVLAKHNLLSLSTSCRPTVLFSVSMVLHSSTSHTDRCMAATDHQQVPSQWEFDSEAFPLVQGNGIPLSVNDVARHFYDISWIPRTLPALLISHAIDGIALVDVTEDDWEVYFHVHEQAMQQQLCRFVRCCADTAKRLN